MLKKSFYSLLVLATIFLLSCDNYEKTETGLRYKLIVDSAGTNAKFGDRVLAHIKFNNGVDSLNSYKRGFPIPIDLGKTFQGSVEEGLTYASKGDSISIKVVNDSLYKLWSYGADTLPEGIKKGSYTTFEIKVVDVYTPEAIAKENADKNRKRTAMGIAGYKESLKMALDSSAAQIKLDEKKVEAYLKKNKLKAEKLGSSVYVVMTEEGKGEKPEYGDSVSVNYVGKLLDGKEFDKSRRPFTFQFGVGGIAPGFIEGIGQLKQGSKAIIIMPSSLAYGKEGVKASETDYLIPPDAPLVFEIELLEVIKQK